MSNLFSKIKALLSAQARGPRRYEQAPPPPTEKTRSADAEVTEAPARRTELPEVTEAPIKTKAPARTAASPSSRPASRIEEPGASETHASPLEEERVADLLKGQQS